jgi:hypothetical protein
VVYYSPRLHIHMFKKMKNKKIISSRIKYSFIYYLKFISLWNNKKTWPLLVIMIIVVLLFIFLIFFQ